MNGLNVHVYPSPMRNESRILRITSALATHGIFDDIVLLGTLDHGTLPEERIDARRRIVRVPRPSTGPGLIGRARRALGWARAAAQLAERWPVACVNAHSLSVLPACVGLARRTGAKLIYDTHELETETLESRGIRRIMARVAERRHIRCADAVSVVNAPIARWYRDRYGLTEIAVIRNLPARPAATLARSGALRAQFGIGPAARLFVYQGILSPGRGIAAMLEAFAGEGAHHLVLIGYGQLAEQVRTAAAASPRIHHLDAVPPDALAAITVEADVGVALIEDVCLSYRLCLPNKLFEYLNAGLPVLISPCEAMREVVEPAGAGWVLPRVEAAVLRQFLETLNDAQLAAASAAAGCLHGQYAWEDEVPALLRLYALLGFAPGRVA